MPGDGGSGDRCFASLAMTLPQRWEEIVAFTRIDGFQAKQTDFSPWGAV
jgi:hypothetical protein